MIVIAGGIGSGKSVVSRILRLNGFGVFDCDSVARNLMINDVDLQEKLRRLLGDNIIVAGQLDRALISRLIFSDEKLRLEVDSLVHNVVRERLYDWSREDRGNIFVETAIAAASGVMDMCDEIWLVTCDRETRIKRIKERNSMGEERIKMIMEAQKDEEVSLRGSGLPVREIRNGEGEPVLERVLALANNLKKD